MSKKIINTDHAPAEIGAYSQGVEVNGIFYFSGQLGINPLSMIIPEDFNSQLNQVMKNIDGLLESQDLKRDNVIKTTIFLTNLSNFASVNSAYEQFFNKPYPARSCVEVSKLPKNGLVEIEVIAAK